MLVCYWHVLFVEDNQFFMVPVLTLVAFCSSPQLRPTLHAGNVLVNGRPRPSVTKRVLCHAYDSFVKF